jgi:hypothetical protein
MPRVSKKEMDDMQSLIDGMQGEPESGRTPDSNTKAETTANKFMDAMGMAEDEDKRRAKLRKIAGQ